MNQGSPRHRYCCISASSAALLFASLTCRTTYMPPSHSPANIWTSRSACASKSTPSLHSNSWYTPTHTLFMGQLPLNPSQCILKDTSLWQEFPGLLRCVSLWWVPLAPCIPHHNNYYTWFSFFSKSFFPLNCKTYAHRTTLVIPYPILHDKTGTGKE